MEAALSDAWQQDKDIDIVIRVVTYLILPLLQPSYNHKEMLSLGPAAVVGVLRLLDVNPSVKDSDYFSSIVN